jgi:putative phosphoribosyl transferase
MHIKNIRTLTELHNQRHVFRDRVHAGEILAGMLTEYRATDALVLAIPAGGVPVAAVIANQLDLQVDILPVSKILFPWTTESGFGAVAYDGTQWINEAAVQHYRLDTDTIRKATRVAQDKVERRIRNLRGSRPFPALKDRNVILVDDGIAAGSTVRAAILTLRKQHSGIIIIATPTAHDTSLQEIASLVDLVFCANLREGWSFAVAEAYRNWTDVSEEEVMEILHANNA